MLPGKIEDFINNKIIQILSTDDIDSAISYLEDNIERYSQRDTFINVSARYLINNWSLIHFKKRYNTYYVIYSRKRMKDLDWIKSSAVSTYMKDDKRVFQSVIFKEKLQKGRYEVNHETS